MSLHKSNGQMSFKKGQGKNTQNLYSLKEYVQKNRYIDLLEQKKICTTFNVPYSVDVFRKIYRARVYAYLFKTIATTAEVSKATGIPEKYICQIKGYYKKRNLIKTLYKSRCSATGSRGVQFLSTNPKTWDKDYSDLSDNQLKMF